jgi:hypothetical protein
VISATWCPKFGDIIGVAFLVDNLRECIFISENWG